MNNPYAAPTADMSLADDRSETYEPSPFALRGRIGRVRWLGYCGGIWLLGATVTGGLVGAMAVRNPALATMAPALSTIILFAVLLIMGARRLNDMNHSAWWTFIVFVPFINFVYWLWLMFGRGTEGRNEYGPAPAPNTKGVIAAAWLVPGLAIVGILAAIAIPAYQDYTVRAKQAQPTQAR